MGIGVSGNASRVTITPNQIFDNGKPLLSLSNSAGGTTNPNSPALLGIDFGSNGITPNDLAASCADGFPDCTPPQNFPTLSPISLWNSNGTIVLNGTLASRPSASYTIEVYASHGLNAAGLVRARSILVASTLRPIPAETVRSRSRPRRMRLATGARPHTSRLPRPMGAGRRRSLARQSR
jgi:hypothetical protein